MITPSDIVKFIDVRFPNAAELQESGDLPPLDFNHGNFMSGLVRLLDTLHPSLLPGGEDRVAIECSKSAMLNTVSTWQARGGSITLSKLPGYDKNPVLILRRILVRCPDQYVPEEIPGLQFIEDRALRDDLRNDIASLENAVRDGQWKVAMVLAGSISEAVLLSVLRTRKPEDVSNAVSQEQKRPPGDITLWHLPTYARVAHALGIISQKSRDSALMAQEYRNLIHPGRQIRLDEKPERSNAYFSYAACHSILEELSAKDHTTA